MTRIRTQETANGPAYIARTAYATTTLVFPHGTRPFLVWGTATIPIDAPERFGPYATPSQRHAYTLAYVDASASAS